MWDAPRAVPPPPRRVWRDWALLTAVVVSSVLEGLLRNDLTGPPWLSVLALVAVSPTVLWRRTRPAVMLAINLTVLGTVGLVRGTPVELVSGVLLIVLPYALVRWGGGRDLILGGAAILASLAVSALTGTSWPDTLGGLVFLLLVAVLAVVFRSRAAARFREIDRVRLLEREQFARDLHDTVAHHVSAIAIRAQAGLALAAQNPHAAADALSVIEAEASRTLTEMRSMVRVLRQGETLDLAPSAGIADIRELAGDGRSAPRVTVRITGDDVDVPATVAAAVYRLAQESVTNARRHARNATRVDVLVEVYPDGVRLSVVDDGEPAPAAAPGFGIAGMRERVALLGGTLHTGRGSGGGWTVEASLPRVGWSP